MRFSPWVEKIFWSGKWHPFQCSCVGEPLDQRSLLGYSDRIAELDATVWACTVTSYMRRILCFSSGDVKITFCKQKYGSRGIYLWKDRNAWKLRGLDSKIEMNETEVSHPLYGFFVPNLRRNLGEFNES